MTYNTTAVKNILRNLYHDVKKSKKDTSNLKAFVGDEIACIPRRKPSCLSCVTSEPEPDNQACYPFVKKHNKRNPSCKCQRCVTSRVKETAETYGLKIPALGI